MLNFSGTHLHSNVSNTSANQASSTAASERRSPVVTNFDENGSRLASIPTSYSPRTPLSRDLVGLCDEPPRSLGQSRKSVGPAAGRPDLAPRKTHPNCKRRQSSRNWDLNMPELTGMPTEPLPTSKPPSLQAFAASLSRHWQSALHPTTKRFSPASKTWNPRAFGPVSATLDVVIHRMDLARMKMDY